MSLVYETKVAAPQPMTHALVIGVGEYLHLRDGSLHATKPANPNLGLKQLSSPPLSAKEFAHWLIASLTNRYAPLGSVELVLSPAEPAWSPPNGVPVPVEAATFANIKDAFGRWDDRCNSHPGNVAIFYFCGHGVEWGSTLLLASDFGADKHTPWDNAINISATHHAVKLSGKARAACFFLDACRDVPDDLLRLDSGVAGRPLKTAPFVGGGGLADLQVLKPAVFGGQAHAPVGDVSYFTKALIRCFGGLGASSPYDGVRWKVSTNSLSQAMKRCMERTRVTETQRGVCSDSSEGWTSTYLHELADTPRVMTTISYVPTSALEVAELSLTDSRNRPVPPRVPPVPEPWETEVPAGDYKVAATFPNKEYPNRSLAVRIAPPYFPCEFSKDWP